MHVSNLELLMQGEMQLHGFVDGKEAKGNETLTCVC